jgi:hypothetical protein
VTAAPASAHSRFATPDRSRPLLSWTAAQREGIGQRVERAFRGWAGDWLAHAEALVSCTCEEAVAETAGEQASWLPLGADSAGAAWLTLRDEPAEMMMAALFAADLRASAAQPELAGSVAQQAWTSLLATLRTALHLGSPMDLLAPAKTEFKPWSGSLALQLRGPGRLALQVLLNGACAQSLVTAPSPAMRPVVQRATLTPILSALADRRLRLRVELSACELDLGTLQELRPGDVVPLPHLLDAPLVVSTENQPLCAGFLGRHAGLKAIELVRESAHATDLSTEHQA